MLHYFQHRHSFKPRKHFESPTFARESNCQYIGNLSDPTTTYLIAPIWETVCYCVCVCVRLCCRIRMRCVLLAFSSCVRGFDVKCPPFSLVCDLSHTYCSLFQWSIIGNVSINPLRSNNAYAHFYFSLGRMKVHIFYNHFHVGRYQSQVETEMHTQFGVVSSMH